jgi:hypothetical protein
MIFNKYNIGFVSKGKTVIGKIYKGAVLIWESVASCFSKGYWLNNKRWTNDKGWKNN